MDIAEWRVKIDELDRQIVALISERATAAQHIGRLKKTSTLPVYEPNRGGVCQCALGEPRPDSG
jgi:chorismate mutase